MSDFSALILSVASLILYGISCYILGKRIGHREAEIASRIEKIRSVINYKDDRYGR